MPQKNARQKILATALKEFASCGFAGARVDRIAREAGVNKAMIFYYFSSKPELYRTVVRNALLDFIPKVQEAVLRSQTPEQLFEILPALYIRYFSKNKDIIKTIGRELIQNPQNITPMIRETFAAIPLPPSKMFQTVIAEWHRKGLITESDPVHLIFNVAPLCLFPIIAKPMVEAIMDVRITDDESFLEKRIQSITNLLKKGMLK